ncbi:MAG: dTDP-4-dehydrorhamnose reductase, partial [Limnobacter sp.]|nr:dTDP-4-dehydrorhamnose reductase [Limnobacter sp.]
MGIRLLVLGKDGQLGHSLATHAKPALSETVDDIVCYGREKVDLTQPDQIVNAIKDVRPDVLINAAAYTQVEKAEDEQDLAMAINAKAVGVMAEQAKKQDVVLVHYSTDYVFDGTKNSPYVETDATNPLSSYGKSKLEGEQYLQQVGGHWVCFRTGWVYAQKGGNFCRTMIKLAKERDSLNIVDDQRGAPTPAAWLAELGLAVAGVAVQKKYKKLGKLAPTFLPDFPKDIPSGEIFHASAAGETTWFDYAEFALELACKKGVIEKVPQLNRTKTETMNFKAQRPAYSVLNTSKLVDTFRLNPPDWTRGVQNLVLNL